MSEAGANSSVSGDWIGFYSYPNGAPPVQFDAVLRETGALISGSIEEVDAFLGHLVATVDGARTGQAIRFTKFYDNGDEFFDTVQYEGMLDAEGNEISGTWCIPGEWSGTFIMTRASGVAAKVAIHQSVSVD